MAWETDAAYRGLNEWERAGIKQDALENSREYIEAEQARDAVKDLCADFAKKMVALANERGILATPYVFDKASKTGGYLRCKPDAATELRISEALFDSMETDFALPTGEEAAR